MLNTNGLTANNGYSTQSTLRKNQCIFLFFSTGVPDAHRALSIRVTDFLLASFLYIHRSYNHDPHYTMSCTSRCAHTQQKSAKTNVKQSAADSLLHVSSDWSFRHNLLGRQYAQSQQSCTFFNDFLLVDCIHF